MKLSDFDFNLPQNLIAQNPEFQRDNCKLLIYKKNNNKIIHTQFFDILNYLDKDTVLVLNNSKVIPARILFNIDNKEHEIFLVKKINNITFDCIIRPGKKFKIGKLFSLKNNITAEILSKSDIGRIIKFNSPDKISPIENQLFELGNIPLPPYVTEFNSDINYYQTVYSKINGSTAAPTAGLHFTEELLNKVKQKITDIIELTLHIGPGTFQPVKSENIFEHKMHSETYHITQNNFDKILKYKNQGKKILAVGTTSVRVLETVFSDIKNPELEGETQLFIYPGYKFNIVDSIITNFHLPKSSLLMLVSAFCSRTKLMEIYKEAISKKYRFFSFGDAMFIQT